MDDTSIKQSGVLDIGALIREDLVREGGHKRVCGRSTRAGQVDKVPDVAHCVRVVEFGN